MNILIGKDGKQLGPFSEDQLRSMIESGMLTSSDLAWHDGRPDWSPLWQILGTPPPLASVSPGVIQSFPASIDVPRPQGLILTSWVLVGTGFLPGIGILSVIALLVCAVVLYRHPHPEAKKQGKILLCIWLALLLLSFAIGIGIGLATR